MRACRCRGNQRRDMRKAISRWKQGVRMEVTFDSGGDGSSKFIGSAPSLSLWFAGGDGMRPTSWAGALSTSRAGSFSSLTPAFLRFENALPMMPSYVTGIACRRVWRSGKALDDATVREAIQQRAVQQRVYRRGPNSHYCRQMPNQRQKAELKVFKHFSGVKQVSKH